MKIRNAIEASLHGRAILNQSMSASIILLVLTAAFIHAWWNLLVKKAGGGLMYIWFVYLVSLIIYLPVAVWQTVWGGIQYSLPLLLFSLTSGMVHLAYIIVLQKGYQQADLSVVYPVARGSGPLLSSAFALLLLGEHYSWLTTAGLLFITTGVLIITRFSFRFWGDSKLKTGVLYGLATGLLIAAYTLIDAIAVKWHGISPVIITLATNLIGLLGLAPLIAKRQEEVKRAWLMHRRSVATVAAVSPLAYIFVLIALKFAPLTAVAPARESSILFGTFLGASALNEEEGKRRMIASAFILAGISCLALG